MSEKRTLSVPERYRSWKAGLNRKQRIRWRVIRIAAVVCAAILLLGALYGVFVRKPNIPSLPVGGDVSGEHEAGVGDRRPGVYTFLVVGKDTGGGGNTDTMILATYDTKEKTLDAMSLPRDTMTNVSWNNKKLNTVFNYYKGKDKATQVEKGMTALKTHVGKLTGIVPDYYVMVEWDAVGELVDAIGGVVFDVPYDMHYDDPYQDLHIHQDKGVRKLTGEDAMEVIRWRKNNGKYGNFQIGDSGRMKVQQEFLVAVAKECLQLKHLMNASEFARIFTENVNTDLTVGNLAWLAQQAIGMNADRDIQFHTMPYTPYTRGTSYVLPVVDELLVLINGGLNPYKEDITADDLEVLQLKGDGSLYLTSGTLEDSGLAKPKKPQTTAKPELPSKPTQPEQDPQPELPPEETPRPEQGTTGEEPGEANPEQPGQEEIPQPEQTPGQSGEEPGAVQSGGETAGAEQSKTEENAKEQEEPAELLPAHPIPVQQQGEETTDDDIL